MSDLIPSWQTLVTPLDETVTTSKIADDAVTDAKINWGTGTSQVSAVDVPLATGWGGVATNVQAGIAELALLPATIITVGAEGCDYTTVASALTAAIALSPSTSNRVVIAICGYYTDATNHALVDYVSIVGMAQGQVKFTGTWTVGTVANQCDIRGVEVNAATLALILATAAITSDLKVMDELWFGFDGSGYTIAQDKKSVRFIPRACYIQGWNLYSTDGVARTCTLGLWSGTWANYKAGTIPTSANKITGTAYPALTADVGQDSSDIAMTGWTLALAADSVLLCNVDANTDAQAVALCVKIARAAVV